MLALFTVFEHLSNVRRLLNRFHVFYRSPTCSTTTSDAQISSDSTSTATEQQQQQQQHDVLLGPVLHNILSDSCLNNFDEGFHEDLQKEEYFARELDACLLEMREIERDLFNLKQRQCYFYERYLDFIDKKDELIDRFLEYHDEYLLNNRNQPISPTTKQLRRRGTIYEFNIPVSNRFELLK